MFKNSLFSKIVLIFTIPVLGILYFSFITVMEKVDTLNDFKKNEIRIDYLKEAQNVILSLEKEKILSLDFIKDSSKLDYIDYKSLWRNLRFTVSEFAKTKKDLKEKSYNSLSDDYVKKTGLTYFLKGKTSNHEVTILNHQESYLLNSFAIADCLIELDEDKEFFKQGEMVRVLMIT